MSHSTTRGLTKMEREGQKGKEKEREKEKDRAGGEEGRWRDSVIA